VSAWRIRHAQPADAPLVAGARYRVRFELANAKNDLRPGMYARVELASDLGNRLQVPSSAVVYTGPRRLVFVDLGGGRFRAVEIIEDRRRLLDVFSGFRHPGLALERCGQAVQDLRAVPAVSRLAGYRKGFAEGFFGIDKASRGTREIHDAFRWAPTLACAAEHRRAFFLATLLRRSDL